MIAEAGNEILIMECFCRIRAARFRLHVHALESATQRLKVLARTYAQVLPFPASFNGMQDLYAPGTGSY